MTWLPVEADDPFGIHNLPYGVVTVGGGRPRIGVRVGDHVLDVGAVERAGLIEAGGTLQAATLTRTARRRRPARPSRPARPLRP